MPENRKIFIVYTHPTGALDEWEVSVPVGWDDMNGPKRGAWAAEILRKKNSSYRYMHFERKRRQ